MGFEVGEVEGEKGGGGATTAVAEGEEEEGEEGDGAGDDDAEDEDRGEVCCCGGCVWDRWDFELGFGEVCRVRHGLLGTEPMEGFYFIELRVDGRSSPVSIRPRHGLLDREGVLPEE